MSAIAIHQTLCYSSLVSKEMESKDSKNQRITAPDSTAVFLRPASFLSSREGDGYKTLLGKEVRSAGSESLTSWLPCRMRVKTFPVRLSSLNQERSMSQSALAIAPTLTVINGIPTTTSVDIAKHFGKRHDDVLRAIRSLLDQIDAGYPRNFAEIQTDTDLGMGRIRKDPAYRLTKDGFTLLAMGFTGKQALQFKLAYIDAFNRMEAQLHGRTPSLLNRRWLVSYDHTGKEQVSEVPEDAFLMSFKQMLEHLNDPGVLIETEVLFEFCIKALERLKNRTQRRLSK